MRLRVNSLFCKTRLNESCAIQYTLVSINISHMLRLRQYPAYIVSIIGNRPRNDVELTGAYTNNVLLACYELIIIQLGTVVYLLMHKDDE
jgi:hypothetical protein